MSTSVQPQGSRVERLGVQYLRALASRRRAVAADAVHVLNPDERAALRAIARAAVARAALAGALSGLACAIPALVLPPLAPDASAAAMARHWGIVGGVTVVASVLEIVFLYWDGLRAVHALAHAAGLDLADDAHGRDALWALARAALEMPNPADAEPGVDPMREASRWRVVLASTLYKLKVALTGFLTKALLRRAMGRAATRAVLELVAMPVTALWDGIVCWLILREAKLRVLGPSAALELTAMILPPSPSSALATCVLRAVASSIVRTQDLHPNLLALLRTVRRALSVDAPADVDDTARFLTDLAALPRDEQTVTLRVLATAAIIDGHLARDEVRLVGEAFAACARPFDRAQLEALRRAFASGDAIPAARIEAIG